MEKREVKASIKDKRLVEKRRSQMVRGAVSLFKEKGFHRTTTREIAQLSGFSIGTLYEYIKTKEDILYLVCDSIYDQVKSRLEQAIQTDCYTVDNLEQAIESYFKVIDELQDEVVVMYQEVKSLPKDALPYVLQKEIEMVTIFEKIIKGCVRHHQFRLSEQEITLLAHHIFVQGHMWAFRRWALQRLYSLQDYTKTQIKFLLKDFSHQPG